MKIFKISLLTIFCILSFNINNSYGEKINIYDNDYYLQTYHYPERVLNDNSNSLKFNHEKHSTEFKCETCHFEKCFKGFPNRPIINKYKCVFCHNDESIYSAPKEQAFFDFCAKCHADDMMADIYTHNYTNSIDPKNPNKLLCYKCHEYMSNIHGFYKFIITNKKINTLDEYNKKTKSDKTFTVSNPYIYFEFAIPISRTGSEFTPYNPNNPLNSYVSDPDMVDVDFKFFKDVHYFDNFKVIVNKLDINHNRDIIDTKVVYPKKVFEFQETYTYFSYYVWPLISPLGTFDRCEYKWKYYVFEFQNPYKYVNSLHNHRMLITVANNIQFVKNDIVWVFNYRKNGTYISWKLHVDITNNLETQNYLTITDTKQYDFVELNNESNLIIEGGGLVIIN